MTLLLWCVFAGVLLPYAPHLVVIASKLTRPEGYDTRAPRAQTARLVGVGGRAWAAEQNAFEAAIVFAPVALIAWSVGADEVGSGLLGVAWVVFRLGHAAAYLADRPRIRTSMFALALGCVAGLMVLAALA